MADTAMHQWSALRKDIGYLSVGRVTLYASFMPRTHSGHGNDMLGHLFGSIQKDLLGQEGDHCSLTENSFALDKIIARITGIP